MSSFKVKKIERYLYAPELNKVHLVNGAVIKAPHVASVRDFRKLFEPCPRYKRVITVDVVNDTYTYLNTTYRVAYRELSKFIKDFKELPKKHNVKGTTIKVTSIETIYRPMRLVV